jgi:hypothetical protein
MYDHRHHDQAGGCGVRDEQRPIGCRSVGNRSSLLSPTIADALLLVDFIGRVAGIAGDDTTSGCWQVEYERLCISSSYSGYS